MESSRPWQSSTPSSCLHRLPGSGGVLIGSWASIPSRPSSGPSTMGPGGAAGAADLASRAHGRIKGVARAVHALLHDGELWRCVWIR